MPPLPPVPNVFRVVLEGESTATQPFHWVNVLHFQWNGTSPTQAVAVAFANATNFLWTTNVAPLCSSQVSLDLVTWTDLSSNTGAVGEFSSHSPGTRGDEPNAANVCMLMSYPLTVRYRGGHPRTYLLAGQATDLADLAHWTSNFTTLADTNWKAFLTGVLALSNSGTALASFGAVSYVDKELNPIPPYRRTTPVFYPITIANTVANDEVASQRRRIGRKRR